MNNPKILIEILNGVVTITSTTKDIEIYIADYDKTNSNELFKTNPIDELVTGKDFEAKLDRIENEFQFPIYPKS